jgi:hypothetical protein
MALLDSSSAMVQTTPYSLILKLSLDNKMQASSNFPLGERKVTEAICGKERGWRIVFLPLSAYEVLKWGSGVVWVIFFS